MKINIIFYDTFNIWFLFLIFILNLFKKLLFYNHEYEFSFKFFEINYIIL